MITGGKFGTIKWSFLTYFAAIKTHFVHDLPIHFIIDQLKTSFIQVKGEIVDMIPTKYKID